MSWHLNTSGDGMQENVTPRRASFPRPVPPPPLLRHDSSTDRGDRLMELGRLSFLFGALSWCLVLPSLVGLPLGVAVYAVAGWDLARIGAGRMDKRGWGRAEAARSRAIDGIILSVPFWYFLGLGLAYLIATGRLSQP